jgi:nicotinate-nucleotide--dimethylbenzimidazole phosphoribosyltransferase
MGGHTEGNGHGDSWKILIGLSVLCAALVFLGGFLHRRALDSAIADRQARSVAFVNVKVADAIKGVDLDKPLKDADAAKLTKKLGVPAGTDVRLFSTAGVPLYGTPGSGSFPADTEGIQAAAAGDQGRVIDGADLRVYTPVRGRGQKPAATAAVISDYTQLRDDASGPLDAVRLPVVGLGIVFLIAGLLLMLQAAKGGGSSAKAVSKEVKEDPKAAPSPPPSKPRVTGFDPVPVTAVDPAPPEVAVAAPAPEVQGADEPAAPKARFALRRGSKKGSAQVETPDEALPPAKAKRALFGREGDAGAAETAASPSADKVASALDREVAIRQALEDQLEQLRTRIQMQDVETNTATQELLAQVEAADRRAEEAEARMRDAGAGVAPAPAPAAQASPDVDARVQQAERELAEARSITADAIARADALQRQVDQAAAVPAPTSDPGAEAKLAEVTAQLSDAQQRASAAEQRAASVESVRDELEVRVAQLGTKAGDLEQRATELETSLNEANAGGDAVRAEIATLTAALTTATARVGELETAPAPAALGNDEDKAEIARLRSELANHMERAQVAEERVATLEADVLAAEHGVRALPAHDAGSESDEVTTGPERAFGEAIGAEAPTGTAPELEPEPQSARIETSPPVHERVDAGVIEATATQANAAAGAEAVVEPVSPVASEPDFARTSESEPEPEPEPEPESEPEPTAPTVAWRAPTPTVFETAAATNGDRVPPAPSDDARYDDIWTAAFAPPQQAEEEPEREPQAAEPPAAEPQQSEPQVAQPAVPEPEASEPEASEPEASEPEASELHESELQPSDPQASESQPSDPRPMTESSALAPVAAAEPVPEVVAEDRPSPPEDEVSAEDDMWSLRARLAEAAARKHPPRANT